MSLRIDLQPSMLELYKVEQTASYLNPSSASAMRQPRRSASPTPQLSDSAISFSPLQPEHYELVKHKIENILDRNLVPDAYREKFVEPFYRVLEEKGQDWFKDQLEDKDSPVRNIVYAILQNFEENSEGKIPRANTEALREVISDLYQNFLKKSCELRLCRFTPSPVPNWYEEDLSTYPRPNEMKDFRIRVGIVNVPSRYALKATLSWGCLGHEVAGHDILGAHPGALNQLKARVGVAFEQQNLSHLTSYWEQWLEEGTADVLGVLNMGPAAAFSLIGFLRVLNEDQSWKLSSKGYVNDVHPIDLVRGYLVAYAVKFLVSKCWFTDKVGYVNGIMSEVEKDATGVSEVKWDTVVVGEKKKLAKLVHEFRDLKWTPYPLDGSIGFACQWINDPSTKGEFINFLISKKLPQSRKATPNTTNMLMLSRITSLDDFKKSAKVFARTVITSKLNALGNRSFSDIRSWNDRDEEISQVFRFLLKINPDVNPVAVYKEGFLAAHVVSAAVMDSIMEQEEEDLTEAMLHRVFQRMTTILQEMNSTNLEWQFTEESSETSGSLSVS